MASTELPRVLLNASYSVDNGTEIPFGWTYGFPDEWGNVSVPLYIADDLEHCDGYAKVQANLSGYAVLLASDTSYCADFYRASFAARKGAEYAMFFGNASEL